MTTAELCAVCGGVLETKTVEHLLKGGTNTASILVTADVCSRCGERYFNMEVPGPWKPFGTSCYSRNSRT